MRLAPILALALCGQALEPPTRDVRVICSTSTAVGNVGAGEDDLTTCTLPANSLSGARNGLRITVFGSSAANAPTTKLYFGGTVIHTHVLPNVGQFELVATILRTGASAQKYSVRLSHDNGADDIDIEQGTTAIDETAPIVVKMTGSATNNNDVIAGALSVEVL